MTSSFCPTRSALPLNKSGVEVVIAMQESGKFRGTLMDKTASLEIVKSCVDIIYNKETR